jgi:UDPglucose 6-dehydrogenase
MNICIVGTGYVGLVTAACFAEMGNQVRCVDVNERVVETLRGGDIHIYEPGLRELVEENTAQGRLSFTTDLREGLEGALFVFITVGTPCDDAGACDLSHVDAVAAQIGQTMEDYKIVVNKSTVPVGAAERVEGIIRRELAARKRVIEFDVVSNPEFLKEGDAVSDFMKPDRVIVGTDNVRVAELFKVLYAPFARSREKTMIMGVKSAEMTKYAANCMLAAKISFINEMANICERVGADVREVRLGVGSDHRIGYNFIYPGMGYGGSCFPKDVKALIATSRRHDYEPQLISAVDNVNTLQKSVLPGKIRNFFEPRGGVAGRTLALWGLSFKSNTDDMREAPSLAIVQALTREGMRVQAYDPVAMDRAREQFADNGDVVLAADQYAALEGADALAVGTEWNQFRNPDFERIKSMLSEPVVFDGRNLYSPAMMRGLGFTYYSIGSAAVLGGETV